VQKTALLLALALTLSPLRSAAQDAVPDTDIDGDGLADSVEDSNSDNIVGATETDPRNADTDGGGEADGSEVKAGRNPLQKADDMTFDEDGDGLDNGQEQKLGTDPQKVDSDDDGTHDPSDPFPLDHSYAEDKDKDQLPDEWERVYELPSTGPANTDTDIDGDGLTNADEFFHGSNPLSNDTDRDGITDGEEVAAGTDPGESACLSFHATDVSLADVANHWSKPSVDSLRQTYIAPFQKPIVQGYAQPGGLSLFLPDRPVTRFELLKMALLSSCVSLFDEAQFGDVSFTDVPRRARPREAEDMTMRRRIIYTAARLGIVKGYEDKTFRPDAPVTRAEALTMLLASSQLTLYPELIADAESKHFADVSPADWFAKTVDDAVKLGLVEGYDDNTFKPHASITRAEAAKVTHFILLGNPLVNGYVLPAEEPKKEPETESGATVTL
jgi:hypothetical protein